MLWTDPEEFMPERFLSSSNEMTSFGGQGFAFLPFGSGRRFCVGWRMAMQVLHLTLARLLQGFEWFTPMDEPVDMTEGHGLALPKATPLRKKREARCRLPEPNSSWPILGHLGLLTGTTPLYRTLAALSEKHGPLFSLQLARRNVIVVSSMVLAKECFTVIDRAFAGRPPLEGWKRLPCSHSAHMDRTFVNSARSSPSSCCQASNSSCCQASNWSCSSTSESTRWAPLSGTCTAVAATMSRSR
ncbi:hypothetical protein EJ110_NYTH51672 [Nymphaea thermarum]|nr:hypothetical protein EJ110_NYTH51672 [Nymphaea thermarum]